MKKLLCCCSLLLVAGMFMVKSAGASCSPTQCAGMGGVCCGLQTLSCTNVDTNCSGYSCRTCEEKVTYGNPRNGSCETECPGPEAFHCEVNASNNCYVVQPMAGLPGVKRGDLAQASNSEGTWYPKWITKALDMIATPANATNCWSGGNFRGFRNATAQTANVASKQCEAKLHVCFAAGDADSAIPCTVNTTDLCDNKCNPTGGGNGHQVACSQTDCQNRCYAARVTGNPDTCN